MTTQRVVLAKVGLDGHDVGVNLIAKSLVAAGIEVIYLGKRVTTDQIVAAALAEDAGAIGVSCLSGGLGYFATSLLVKLRESDAEDIRVIAGGIDEPGEIREMLSAGVYRYFGPGTPMGEIVGAFADVCGDV